MNLTCGKCGHQHPLSDDDVVFFHPRFFCLSCGDRIPMKIDESSLEKLRVSNNRDRKIENSGGAPAQETVRQVRAQTESEQGKDGA